MKQKQIYSVSSINRYIKSLFMDDYALNHIYVRGEVSNCKYHTSGHIYFTLKDKSSAMACVMFAGNRRGLDFRLTEGMSVVVFGSMDVYERDGRYQLYAREIRQEGAGQLYAAYEALKRKLLAEGLFDAEHKKAIPPYPRRLGVVTARTGAAIQDIINVSLRRNPWLQIVFCPAQVQGEGASASVVAAIHALEDYGVDVMIVGRGGGSMEDLWAFNEENVARAVYECGVPVISAVGHETDTTIIDFVSDLRAPTPSAAAELAVPDMRVVESRLSAYDEALDNAMEEALNRRREKLLGLERIFRHLSPRARLTERRRQLADRAERMTLLMDRQLQADRQRTARYKERMQTMMERGLDREKARLAVKIQKLEGLSPLRQLERGYAYVTDGEGHGITSIEQAPAGTRITVAMTDGEIEADVTGSRGVSRGQV